MNSPLQPDFLSCVLVLEVRIRYVLLPLCMVLGLPAEAEQEQLWDRKICLESLLEAQRRFRRLKKNNLTMHVKRYYVLSGKILLPMALNKMVLSVICLEMMMPE